MNKTLKVALTGATGNMGREALAEILKLENLEFIRLLVLPDDKRIKTLLRKHKKQRQKIQVAYGNLASYEACKKLIEGVDYVFNLAAVIPPLSDKAPEKAVECNQIGAATLVKAIEQATPQPKLVHVSTVALYGNRNHLHPWAQVGDPLLVSPYDIYSATKLRGEFTVLESDIEKWAVIRQSAMLHLNMLKDNMSDGLMFHTCFNAPLEWVTAHDSGVLMANILKKDSEQDLGDRFWKKVFNIGSLAENRITGYDTLGDGFKLIGGSTKDFFRPYYNATRNFHGVWFYDGHKLDELFGYQTQSVQEYWTEIGKKYGYYKLGKTVPKSLIGKFAIKRLFKDDNSPAYWYSRGDEPRLQAYFGGKKNYEELLKTSWENFGLLVENKDPEMGHLDYEALRSIENAKMIDYGFDFDKPDSEIDTDDLRNVAEAHGGELLTESFSTGNVYSKLRWQNSDGEEFTATAYSVLRAGHWYNPTYTENVWDFDRLSKTDKIFAQLWYDSHLASEDFLYAYDENFTAVIREKK